MPVFLQGVHSRVWGGKRWRPWMGYSKQGSCGGKVHVVGRRGEARRNTRMASADIDASRSTWYSCASLWASKTGRTLESWKEVSWGREGAVGDQHNGLWVLSSECGRGKASETGSQLRWRGRTIMSRFPFAGCGPENILSDVLRGERLACIGPSRVKN